MSRLEEREGWLRTLSTERCRRRCERSPEYTATWLKGAIGMSIFLAGAMALNVIAVVLITIGRRTRGTGAAAVEFAR